MVSFGPRLPKRSHPKVRDVKVGRKRRAMLPHAGRPEYRGKRLKQHSKAYGMRLSDVDDYRRRNAQLKDYIERGGRDRTTIRALMGEIQE